MLCAKDYFTQTDYNTETKNQLWMSMIADSHDIHCKCDTPFAHLLASIFPPGHSDRELTINQILTRDFKQLRCLSGGGGEKGFGKEETHTSREKITEKENLYVEDEELREFIAAAGEDATGR